MEAINRGKVCDRDSHCINFSRSGKTFCDDCGITITMNHYHDSVNSIRLCDKCFQPKFEEVHHSPSLPNSRLEPRECANYYKCFSSKPYGLYVRKSCCGCGKYPLMRHYHDIASNVRFCLTCLSIHQAQNGRDSSYVPLGSKSQGGENE